ncbi:GLPGLI family protein [Flavobacterium sp. LHD-80]|uniref:GLPGLI family protein n=1 Tax=Flavobacterium sp. LHD-80 TaxID=3071411 RepID=UPI0027E027B7|nr:GLPGLI family protein [Flavobacterium sp. LHD-80]MDQ6469998.1 GLPGLI family protein [Flavobacterium sp. LHD-80]
MKNKIFLLFLFAFANIHSQTITDSISCVTYKMGLIPNEAIDNKILTLEEKKKLDDYKAARELIECKLYFNKNKSIYSLVEKLDVGDPFIYKLVAIRAKGIFYKDIGAKEKIEQRDYGGLINVIHPYDEYKWEITNETKMINGYKCYKAICTYQEFSTKRNKMLTFTPEVWFAPELSFPFGPVGLDGVPGLVLEASLNSRTYFYATKIEFNIKNPEIKIEKPSKGKYITMEESLK